MFFENSGFVFFKMGVFSKMKVCFLKIRLFLENGYVFRKWGVCFLKMGVCFLKIRVFFRKWVCFTKMRGLFF